MCRSWVEGVDGVKQDDCCYVFVVKYLSLKLGTHWRLVTQYMYLLQVS